RAIGEGLDKRCENPRFGERKRAFKFEARPVRLGMDFGRNLRGEADNRELFQGPREREKWTLKSPVRNRGHRREPTDRKRTGNLGALKLTHLHCSLSPPFMGRAEHCSNTTTRVGTDPPVCPVGEADDPKTPREEKPG